MDGSLFSKYQKAIKTDGDKKDRIIDLVEKNSGIILTKEEIVINKKSVSFNISSAKKTRLHQVNIRKIISENGYTLNY